MSTDMKPLLQQNIKNKQKTTTTTIIHVQHISYMRISSDATRKKAHHSNTIKQKTTKKIPKIQSI